MKNLYYLIFIAFCVGLSATAFGQNCTTLQVSFQTFESRCAATGAIKITTSGGSGSYKYRLTGPVNVNFTSTDSITGLAAGTYTVYIDDIDTECELVKTGVIVPGNYADPRFTLSTVSVSCDNGVNGSILVENVEKGRAPFLFSIAPPSPMGVGTTSATGVFTGLKGGDYSIRLTDSCGGIQTRTISIENYTWAIDSYKFEKFLCDSAKGWIKVIDSRGNVSTVSGIPGMQYGVLGSGTDTLWSNDPDFRFKVGVNTKSVKAFAKDACGNIKQISANVFLFPVIDADVTQSNLTCTNFTVSVTGMANFFQPEFCLYNQAGTKLFCNTTGEFTGLSYGTYCIKARDLCADTIIERCFTVSRPVPFVADDVLISNKVCETFTAAITGQVNVTIPEYFLYNNNNVLVERNETGVFNNVPYGEYCIKTHDRCIDTTLINCFSVGKPMPFLTEILHPVYLTCTNFGLNVGGDSLYNPVYCLIDEFSNVVECNNTGKFDSIPIGSYCVNIYDECRDTTFQRCLKVSPLMVINDMLVVEESKTCSTFTAHVYTMILSGSEFFLYDEDDNLITQNNSGIFTNLAYGSYCVKAVYPCPDTTVTTCFDAIQPVPKVDANFTATNKNCATFTAKVTGQVNLTNPTYYLVSGSGDTLSSNNTGVFTDVTYGNYCILVEDHCFDTTLKLCRTVSPPDFSFSVSASPSCAYGTTKLNVSASSYPVTIFVYNPADMLVLARVLTKSSVIDSVPGLSVGQQYKIVAEDACSNQQEVMITPLVNYINHYATILQKCPGAEWVNGSGNIVAHATTNTGNLTVRIIKKNGINLLPLLVPDVVKNNDEFTFQDLGPGTYIVSYQTSDACSAKFYDTVTIVPYEYPNLDRSSAYQCDVNGFSVGAVVTNGVGPFSYEIIGSMPETPSIIAGPQSDPVFTIDNGYSYTLIRLRALDACGNATLGDASILPLANSEIKATENCLGMETTLTVDTLYNGTVKWFYQQKKTDPDSVLVGEGFQFTVDPLTISDTGYYYAKVELNNGCITRFYDFNLNGDCYSVVNITQLNLSGRIENDQNLLFWNVRNDQGVKLMVIERKSGESFEMIGSVDLRDYISPGQYRFFDREPLPANYYRIKMIFENGKSVYSNVIYLNRPATNRIRVYPNPVKDILNIELQSAPDQVWNYEFINSVSQQTVLQGSFTGQRYVVHRTRVLASGLYLLKLTNSKTGHIIYQRIIFGK